MLSFLATVALAACASRPVDPPAGQSGQDAARSGAASIPLVTAAERSDYRATAKYDDVKAFIDALAGRSELVRVSDIGKTGEGRAIPLVVIADPPVGTPEDARKSGKLVVLAFGNIHGGEVDGKDGLMALMRDVIDARETKRTRDEETTGRPEQPAAESDPPSLRLSVSASLLDHLVLCFVPIYNADGNERFGKDTRPGQNGPEEGQGRRANAAGLDLNRDFVKLEAPETRALLKFINAWDPAILIDTHTTNGSYHRYPMTYAGPKHPAGDPRLIEFAREQLFPAVAKTVDERHNLKTWYYGNFNADRTRWEDYPDEPRYGVNSFGLRNRLGVLTESYSYAPFKDRVLAQQQFVGAVLEFAAGHHEEIRKLIDEADKATVKAGERAGTDEAQESDAVAIRSKAVAFDEKVTILGYDEERRDNRTVPTTPRDYEVEHVAKWVPDRTVPRPAAYLIPMPPAAGGDSAAAAMKKVVETLQRHGVPVEELREDLELDVEAYAIDGVTKATRPFQGHETVLVEATASAQTRRIAAGAYVIRTNIPLGSLAVYLLEPESADGLTTWNFFDPWLTEGGEFPVLRLPGAAGMLTIAAAPPPDDGEAPPPPKPLTFEVTLDSPPNLNGAPTSISRWIDDETFVQSKGGKSWKVSARTGRGEPVPEPDTSKIVEALTKLPTLSDRDARRYAERAAARPPRGRPGEADREGPEPEGFFFDHENDLYYARFDGEAAVRLTSSPQREELASMSPDGEFVAFVRDNDLWVVDVDTQTERALTTGGADLTRNGKADWVYFEEVFNRNWRTYWWSPDSARIAYLRIDSTPVKTFTIVNNIPGQQVVERTPYPRPGEPNPRATVHVVGVAGGEPRGPDLSGYNPEDALITGVGWWPDSANFYVFVQNRTQTWLDMLAFPADGGGAGDGKKLFRETTRAWVATPAEPTFLKDGSFLLPLERTGWEHFYHFARDGTLKRQITEGEWETRGVVRLVEGGEGAEAGGRLYFTAMRDGPVAPNLYRVNLDGSGLTRLTTEPGSHSVSLSPNGKLFADSWSTVAAPTQVALRSADDGALIRVLDTNPVRDLAKYALRPVERVQIPMPDGFVLEGTLILPADLDPEGDKKYPVWLQTYAGPHAPTVSDGWSGGRAFEQALAADGIIAFRTDPRSASGKGAVSAWACYRQMGVSELADLEAAVQWLAQRPYVDAERIGISGHSYGGFMTSYALTHSAAFAAGIAGAPVTDWRDYDTIYTERMMLTPQENPDGYEKTSVVGGAKNLHGRLLLLHGMIDDNVHLANASKLVHALQRANKQFEIMFYPENRHGLGGKHYQQLQIDFIRRTMGAPKTAPSEPTQPPPPPPVSGP